MRRKFLASFSACLLAFVLLLIAAEAQALNYPDILGKWCSATARMTLTRDTMSIFLFSTKKNASFRIKNYEFAGPLVTVNWYDDKELSSSTFGEFSADRRIIFLQPDKGSNIPRREYRRC